MTNVVIILFYLQADDVVPESEAGEFVDYQTNMVKCCKAIIKLSQDMVRICYACDTHMVKCCKAIINMNMNEC